MLSTAKIFFSSIHNPQLYTAKASVSLIKNPNCFLQMLRFKIRPKHIHKHKFRVSRLPEHETAWAMTVHKSQGSEFNHAALILPTQLSPVVTRELVYTAITRARQRLSLYADERVLSQAIATRTERRSGLSAIFESV